jgi:hypothetical protein
VRVTGITGVRLEVEPVNGAGEVTDSER